MNSLPVPSITLIQGASLFLDFDGTLVEIAERPDAVEVDPGLTDLLHRLGEKLEGRLAIVTGRPAMEARELLGGSPMSFIGSHGLEFLWADGRVDAVERPSSLATALNATRELEAATSGLIVEDKPLGVALHFRQNPAAEAACVKLAVRLATKLGLELQYGKMMVELRPPGADKGSAIRKLMEEPPFCLATPLFMGDDLTDESAFLTASMMGGAGVLIGAQRPSAAGYRLGGVAEARAWLLAAGEAL
jgi:trehalose 6-phosphate phosphatase